MTLPPVRLAPCHWWPSMVVTWWTDTMPLSIWCAKRLSTLSLEIWTTRDRSFTRSTARRWKQNDAPPTSKCDNDWRQPSGLLRQPATTGTQPRQDGEPAVFVRDHYTCRYADCQRRTVDDAILRLISKAVPDVMPFHRNWKLGQVHPLFWTHTASLKHVQAWSVAGSNDAESNLVTACSCCQYAKNYYDLETLGWELSPVSDAIPTGTASRAWRPTFDGRFSRAADANPCHRSAGFSALGGFSYIVQRTWIEPHEGLRRHVDVRFVERPYSRGSLRQCGQDVDGSLILNAPRVPTRPIGLPGSARLRVRPDRKIPNPVDSYRHVLPRFPFERSIRQPETAVPAL